MNKLQISFPSKIWSATKEILKISIICYIGFGIVLFFFQNHYIYQPDKTDFANCPAFSKAEKITYNSSRGYFTKRSPDKVIVFFHGNAGRACDRDNLDSFFSGSDYSTYFAEYSGYAEEKGTPSMGKILKNVTDTIDFLKTQNFKNITVISESIGGGPAAYYALNSKVDKLILITTYTNFSDVTFSHYPVYPTDLLLRSNFTPEKWLSDYTGPLSIILAEKDEIVPNKLGKELFEKIPSDSKKLYIVKDAGHNTIYEKEDFYTYLTEALK